MNFTLDKHLVAYRTSFANLIFLSHIKAHKIPIQIRVH
jgi:hypothetical protein